MAEGRNGVNELRLDERGPRTVGGGARSKESTQVSGCAVMTEDGAGVQALLDQKTARLPAAPEDKRFAAEPRAIVKI